MKTLSMILQFLPLVLQAVVAIEQAIGAGNGATKKDIVMSSIQAASKLGEKSDDKVIQTVSVVIDTVVSSLNKTGFFQSTTAKAAT